jgi:3-methyl-2-oxobutanoate hydroxymethyltransferase
VTAQRRQILLSSCALAATASEARYRIAAPAPAPRAARVVALDEAAAALLEGVAATGEHAARFFRAGDEPAAQAGGLPPLAPLGEDDDEPFAATGDDLDILVMVATTGAGAPAAAALGRWGHDRRVRDRPHGRHRRGDRAATPREGAAGHRRRRRRPRRADGLPRMSGRVRVQDLHRMKREGAKVVGVVAYDHHTAAIADRVGVDLVSAGDTVGVNLWGHTSPLQVTLAQMVLVAAAVRSGVTRALVSADLPYGPAQEGVRTAVRAAVRLVAEADVDLVKVDAAADHPAVVEALSRAGIGVFAQLGLTPHTAMRFGIDPGDVLAPGHEIPAALTDRFVADAVALQDAGAVLLDLTNAGPVAGAAVVAAVDIPVLGGRGGGPWLDGRMRLAQAATGATVDDIDDPIDAYAHLGQATREALAAYAADVRDGRRVRADAP